MKKIAFRYLFFILLYTVCFPCISRSQLLNIGDTLYTYMQRNLIKYKLPMGDISSWIEGKDITILTYQPGVDSSKPNFLSWRGIPFGVLEGIRPNAYYLFDTDGDGTLDYRTDKPLTPIWLVSYNSKVVDSTSILLDNVLNIFFKAFQSDTGLVVNDQTKPAFATLMGCSKDTLFPNRDLVYQLWYNTIFAKRDPAQSLMAMQIFERTYNKRFHRLHPIIKLYELESAIQIRNYDLARSYLQELQNIAPDFIPGKYYAYILQQDESLKSSQRIQLEQSYPNHWIIKKMSK
jgi:hypothetical protein